MKIDKKLLILEPVDLAAANWQATRHKGPAIVRGESADQAREIAKEKLCIAVERTAPGQDTLFCPWGMEEDVTCSEYTGGDYSIEGEPDLLSPRT